MLHVFVRNEKRAMFVMNITVNNILAPSYWQVWLGQTTQGQASGGVFRWYYLIKHVAVFLAL